MPESAAEQDSSQVGLAPTRPPVCADDRSAGFEKDAEFTDADSLTIQTVASSEGRMDPDEEPIGLFAHLAIALTSLGTMSVMSSAMFHLLAWGTALLLLPLFGFDWRELYREAPQPIVASLSDEDVLDDLPRLEFVGSIDVEMDKPQSSLQQLATQLEQSDAAWLKSVSTEMFAPASEASDGAGDSAGVLLKIPEGGFAVTKGSFTAFTIPATPQPLKPYRIVIEVRLPGTVKKYRVGDLKGVVVGTDEYTQKLPYDDNVRSAASAVAADGKLVRITSSSTAIDVINNRVQIIIAVPGAKSLVRDRIKIRSARLREEQELVLTFGKPPAGDTDE